MMLISMTILSYFWGKRKSVAKSRRHHGIMVSTKESASLKTQQRPQVRVRWWRPYNLPQINTWNKQKQYISIMFACMVFQCTSLDNKLHRAKVSVRRVLCLCMRQVWSVNKAFCQSSSSLTAQVSYQHGWPVRERESDKLWSRAAACHSDRGSAGADRLTVFLCPYPPHLNQNNS